MSNTHQVIGTRVGADVPRGYGATGQRRGRPCARCGARPAKGDRREGGMCQSCRGADPVWAALVAQQDARSAEIRAAAEAANAARRATHA